MPSAGSDSMTGEHTVMMQEGTFESVRLSVPTETSVIWRNDDTTDHRIVSVQFHDAAADWHFRSQSLHPGDTVVYTFDDDGVYEYFCRLHGNAICGAILVGETSLADPLPCEDEASSTPP